MHQLQFELPKLDKNRQRRGGKRKGAGRKAKPGCRPSERHKKRLPLRANEPVHVTLRVVAAVADLRKRHLYHALRDAMITTFGKDDFRIVHISIQHGHVHMLVEASDEKRLWRGMQGFESVAAKEINRAISKCVGKTRKGRVFADRYHPQIIRTPTQARHALSYVLNNWRKHREDRVDFARGWLVDPYSSGISFPGWTELDGTPWMWKPREGYDPLPVYQPKTWLLRVGWKRVGPISARDIPASSRVDA